MGCCNKAPNGGSSQLGVLLKWTLCIAIVVFLIAAIFG